MTWQETIGFLTGCMPRPVGRALMQQPEGSVREIRVRAGGKVRILTAEGEISCACAPTQPQVDQMAEALCEHALYARKPQAGEDVGIVAYAEAAHQKRRMMMATSRP